MAKKVIKEIGLVLLLLIAIILVFTIIFYDYIPNNKTVPVKIQAYNIPEDIQNELKESFTEGENIVKTYYIDDTDLNSYESTKDYDKGKANPFADYSTENTQNNENNNSSNNNNSNNSNTENSSNDENNTKPTEQNEVYMNTPGKNS